MQDGLHNRVKRDVIIRNQKNTFRNSMKLLKPEEVDQRKVINFPDTVEGSENRASGVGRKIIFSPHHTYVRRLHSQQQP